MKVVRYHPKAREEFLRQVVFYSDVSTRLAERYDKAVRNAVIQAAEAPERWLADEARFFHSAAVF